MSATLTGQWSRGAGVEEREAALTETEPRAGPYVARDDDDPGLDDLRSLLS